MCVLLKDDVNTVRVVFSFFLFSLSMVKGCSRELSAHFCHAISLKYHVTKRRFDYSSINVM